MALLGIWSKSADSGCWTMAIPPASLISLSPGVPWLPVPESTMRDRPLLLFLGQRAEEAINGRLMAARFRGGGQAQPPVVDRQKLIGRDDVDVIDLN